MSLRFLAPMLLGAFALAACGSGGVATTPAATAPPAPTTASSNAIASSGATAAVPPLGALTAGSIVLPAVTVGSGASLTLTAAVGASSTQSLARRDAASIVNPSAFAQFTITANAPVTFAGAFVATIAFTGGPATYFGTFEDQNGALSSSPQMTATGTAYTFTSPSGTYSLVAGQSLSFSFSASQTANAPMPSALVFGATSLTFLTTGAAAAQTDTVTEANHSDGFLVSSENPAIATATINGGTITVTPVGVGTTSLDVAGGAAGKISVTVTTSPVTIQ